MFSLKKRRKSQDQLTENKLALREVELMNHPAWRGTMSLREIKKELEGKLPFTFAVSETGERHHYFLSYVGKDHKVKQTHAWIFVLDGEAYLKNLGSCKRPCSSIDELVDAKRKGLIKPLLEETKNLREQLKAVGLLNSSCLRYC